jgi:hypothetical protein
MDPAHFGEFTANLCTAPGAILDEYYDVGVVLS